MSMIGLLVVEMVIGYEWFISGLVKFVRNDFPAGLADEFTEKSEGVATWYASFLENAVIPNAKFFGYAVEFLGEGGKGLAGAINMLAGIKVRVREGILFGLAYQLPLTDRREFTNQVVFGPDFGWKR